MTSAVLIVAGVVLLVVALALGAGAICGYGSECDPGKEDLAIALALAGAGVFVLGLLALIAAGVLRVAGALRARLRPGAGPGREESAV